MIRRATEADIPEIVRLKEMLMVDGWPWPINVDDAWRERCAQIARDLLARESYRCFVIDAEGGVASCVTVAIEQHLPGPDGNGKAVYIGDMCTDAPYRGRGYGSQLLEAAAEWAREQGAGWASLYATDSGQGVYERGGFAIKGPFQHMSIGLD